MCCGELELSSRSGAERWSAVYQVVRRDGVVFQKWCGEVERTLQVVRRAGAHFPSGAATWCGKVERTLHVVRQRGAAGWSALSKWCGELELCSLSGAVRWSAVSLSGAANARCVPEVVRSISGVLQR